jgi:molybdopterin synthase catalytic subunit/molybdopterin converting factor small subunit
VNLTIRLFASLRERAGAERLEVADLDDPLTVGDLKRALEERHPELGSLASTRGVLGTSYVRDDTPLTDGQEVSFLPPVSGGASDLKSGVFEVVANAVEPEDARARVTHASCGACVVFTGTTRERNRERDVARLDYEAFEEMARTEMERIFDGCLERFGPPAAGEDEDPSERQLRMLVLHRTGTVDVGQPSVVVAVASPHRDAAFLAARYLIDELKKSVPFWKKERYADGHHWIGDRS